MRNYRKRLILFAGVLCMLLASLRSLAGDDPTSTSSLRGATSTFAVNQEILTQDQNFYDPAIAGTIEHTYKIRNVVWFGIDPSSAYFIQTDLDVTVSLELTKYDAGGASTVDTINLRVVYKKSDTAKNQVLSYYPFSDAYKVNVKILSITPAAAVDWDYTKVLFIKNDLTPVRDYMFNCHAVMDAPSIVTPTISNPDEIKVSWTDPGNGQTEYDLEWAWVDESALSFYKDESGNFSQELLFDNNATRVTVAAQVHDYFVPVLYDDTGRVFLRIRPVQTKQNGQRIEGDWSLTNATEGRDMFSFTGHEPSLNWQANTSYAEEGKRKTVIQYFDGSLRSRQTVTKDNSYATDTASGTTIVAETFYDYQGRAVVQVLPAPTLNTVIQYSHNFNQNAEYEGYSKSEYDLLGADGSLCSDHAAPLSDVSGAAQYYSSNNPEKNNGFNQYIPDSKGYPLTETRYTPDATGRIAAQGGVGPDHQIGSGHETRYTYEVPAQNELDALFGTDAGFASHYTKNWVKDANGQYSVSYVDMQGKTVATALAGKAPANLDSLPSFNTRTITKSLLDPTVNVVSGRSIVSTSSMVLPVATNVTFDYKLTPEQLRLINCDSQPICYSCLYNLIITVTPDCNTNIVTGSPHIDSNFTLGQYAGDTICAGQAPLFRDSFALFLNEGTYTITKELQLSSAAQNYYRDSVFMPENTCKSLQTFINSQQTLLTGSLDCNPTCASCNAALGANFDEYVHKVMAQPGSDTALLDTTGMTAQLQQAYTLAKADCDRLCNAGDDGLGQIRNLRQIMLEDMTPPGGQYAKTGDTFTSLPYNIFSTAQPGGAARNRPPVKDIANPYPYYVNPLLIKPGISQDDSLSLNGYTLSTQYSDDQGNTFPVSTSVAPADLAQAFQPGYAEELLPYHPEYAKLVLSETKLRTSYNYEGMINDVNTWADAVSHDLIQHMLDNDPFFSGAGKNYKLNMSNKLHTYYSASCYDPVAHQTTSLSLSMWQVALAAVFCRDSVTSISACTSPQFQCAAAQPAQPADNAAAGSSCSDWDYAWKIFKTTYLGERKRWIDQYLIDQTHTYIDTNNIRSVKIKDSNNQDSSIYTIRFSSLTSNPGGDPTYAAIQSSINSGNFTQLPGLMVDTLQLAAASTCVAYANGWYSQLMTCPSIDSVMTPEDSAWIIQQLEAVCAAGSDANHPLGSSSIAPDVPAIHDTSSVFGGDYRSFPDVITRYLTAKSIPVTALCNPYQIDEPAPYTQRSLADMPIYAKPDTCQCNQISAMKALYTSSGYSGTFSQFLDTQFGTHIAQDSLDILEQLCNNTYSCNFLVTPISLPPVLQCGSGSNLSSTCISCGQLQQIRTRFFAAFGKEAPIAQPEDDSSIALNLAFQHYANFQTGFTKTWEEYVDFMSECSLSGVDTAQADSIRIPVQEVNNYWGTGISSDSLIRLYNGFTAQYPNLEKVYYGMVDTTNAYTDPAYYYWDAKGKTHADYSGCDTTFWRINQHGWNQDPAFRMADYHSNGILRVPDTDSFINTAPSFNFVKSVCVNGGFTITMRIKDSINDAYKGLCPYSGQDNLYGLVNFETMFSGGYFDIRSAQTDSGQSLGMHNDGGSITALTDTLHDPTISADYSQWRVVQLQALGGQFKFIVDGVTKYTAPLSGTTISKVNFSAVEAIGHELQLDYWKVADSSGTIVYDEEFNSCNNQPAVNVDCPLPPKDTVFKEYFNQVLQTHYSYSTIDSIYRSLHVHTRPFTPRSGPLLCGLNEPVFPDITQDPGAVIQSQNLCHNLDTTILGTAEDLYTLYQDSLRNVFDTAYYNKCMQAKNLESFTATYNTFEYHYTLYYYDQAGNLVTTVSPAGVDLITRQSFADSVDVLRLAVQNGADPATHYLAPQHHKQTHYRYNTLNQVIAQSTPDAGTSRFWYDRLGRLAVSQNAKQADSAQYSYTEYDAIGRITEVGQKPQHTAMTQTISQDTLSLQDWLNDDGVKTQITRTIYDIAYAPIAVSTDHGKGLYQANLRNRVSYTYIKNTDDPGYVWDAATFYSYDIHGNVDTLLQDYNTGMGNLYCTNDAETKSGNRFKRIVYQYDLISGKVNDVAYQPGQVDQFYHHYSYDAENRITSVQTSKDSILWQNDASYQYYRHGPLARTVLGQNQVQGIDYAYTLQGWLKGVNNLTTLAAAATCSDGTSPNYLTITDRNAGGSPSEVTARLGIFMEDGYSSNPDDEELLTVDSTQTLCDNSGNPSGYPLGDMGGDGYNGSPVARDAYSFNLNYYQGDYQPVAPAFTGAGTGATADPLPGTNAGADLFNGNISSMAVNLAPAFAGAAHSSASAGAPMLYAYRYDQLNRLVGMDAFTGLNTTTNVWTPVATDDYKERVTYDPDGNILTYYRNGAVAVKGLAMDNLHYNYDYYTAGGTRKTYNPAQPIPNDAARLTNQLNAVNDAIGGNYTEDIKDQSANNYSYDKIGNLTSDEQGGIQSISWTVYGKIQSIAKTDGTAVNYTYDAAGNRISKTVQVSGRSLKSTYYVRDATGNVMSIYEGGDSAINNTDLTQREIDLYGSARLGVSNVRVDVQDCAAGTDTIINHKEGEISYELSNHLGNIYVVVSDKHIAVSDSADTTQVGYYTANIISATDYYPFGMQMPGRSYLAPASAGAQSQYRYGFNGQEKSNEIANDTYTAEYWEYDSRIGRRWNLDPKGITWGSPYMCLSDNPIFMSDVRGDSAENNIYIGPNGQKTVEKTKDNFDQVFNYYHGSVTLDANGKATFSDDYEAFNGSEKTPHKGYHFDNDGNLVKNTPQKAPTTVVSSQSVSETSQSPSNSAANTKTQPADNAVDQPTATQQTATVVGTTAAVVEPGLTVGKKVAVVTARQVEAGSEEAAQLMGVARTAKVLSQTVKIIGGIAGIANTYYAGQDLYNHPSWGNAAKFVGNLTETGFSIFADINPAVGITIAVFDASGISDQVYKTVGKWAGDKPGQ